MTTQAIFGRKLFRWLYVRRMIDQLDPKELVTLKELLMSEVIQSDALINLLDRKGITTKKELLEEMKKVQRSMVKAES